MTRLMTLAAGVWGKLGLLALAAVALLGAVGLIRKGGADAARVEQGKANKRVEARVEAVQPPAPGETSKALKEGRF